jgi:hypothetical protein
VARRLRRPSPLGSPLRKGAHRADKRRSRLTAQVSNHSNGHIRMLNSETGNMLERTVDRRREVGVRGNRGVHRGRGYRLLIGGRERFERKSGALDGASERPRLRGCFRRVLWRTGVHRHGCTAARLTANRASPRPGGRRANGVALTTGGRAPRTGRALTPSPWLGKAGPRLRPLRKFWETFVPKYIHVHF